MSGYEHAGIRAYRHGACTARDGVVSEVDPRDVRNAGKAWLDTDVKRLRNLALGGQIMRLMVREMGRPEEELRAKAAQGGVRTGDGRVQPADLYEENK